MAIQFLGTGGLWTRVGKLGHLFNQLVAFAGNTKVGAGLVIDGANGGSSVALGGSTVTVSGCQFAWFNTNNIADDALTIGPKILPLDAHIEAIADQFSADEEGLELLDPVFSSIRAAARVVPDTLSAIRDYVRQLIIATVEEDLVRSGMTLQEAITEVFRQMKASGYVFEDWGGQLSYVKAAPLWANAHGDWHATFDARGGDGIAGLFILAEILKITCTQDTDSGAGANKERFHITGQAAENDPLSWNWTLSYQSNYSSGSGCSVDALAADPTSSSDNLLTGGQFESFDASTYVPDGWTQVDASTGGAAPSNGTGSFGPNGSGYRGSNALKLVGQTVATNPEFYQAVSGILPNTVYVPYFRAKTSLSGSDAGTITLALTDGSGTVINNDYGLAQTLSLDKSSLGASTATADIDFSAQNFAVADVVRFQFEDGVLDVTAGSVTEATATTTIKNAWNASKGAAFARFTASNTGATLTLTADTVGPSLENLKVTILRASGEINVLYYGIPNVSTVGGNSDKGGTTYAPGPLSRFFQTPSVLPAVVRFRIKVTTGLAAGKNVVLDDVGLFVAEQLYEGGPAFKIIAGATRAKVNDRASAPVGSIAQQQGWITFLERTLGLRMMPIENFPQGSGSSDGTVVAQSLLGNIDLTPES